MSKPVRAEIEELSREHFGGLVMIECLLSTLIAHLAANFDNQGQFIAQIMANTEANLERALQQADDEDRPAAQIALHRFQRLSASFIFHLTTPDTAGQA